MTETDFQKPENVRPRMRLGVAWACLWWERLWRLLWGPCAIVGAFLALALFGLPQSLPGGLHVLLIGVTTAGVLGVGWWEGRRFSVPTKAEAKRRLESDNNLAHRPLQTLDDVVAGGDQVAEALWRIHQERVASSLERLRVRAPQPDIVENDPYALRVLVALFLLVAGIGAWGEWATRVETALSPQFSLRAATPAPVLDVWVTPPEYTGLAPQFLRSGEQGGDAPTIQENRLLTFPKDSVLIARVRGGDLPTLYANETRYRFETVEPGTFQITQSLESGARVAVNQRSQEIAGWAVSIIADQPPTVSFAEPPKPGQNGALRVAYRAADDYGLTNVLLEIRPASGDDDASAQVPLSLPSARPRQVSAVAIQDLSAHPLAGTPVILTLVATDAAGQSGRSGEVAMVLPARDFSHPVARAVIQIRHDLIFQREAARAGAAERLLDLGLRPDDFRGDFVVALALRTAAMRLLLDDDRDSDSLTAVEALLWDTALRVEDGQQSLAERDVRDAERRLSEALENGASAEDLARAMEELRNAVTAYLQALDAQQAQMMAAAPNDQPDALAPLGDLANAVDSQDIQAMLDRMKMLAETGSRDAARQMLADLQQLMENMKPTPMSVEEQKKRAETARVLRELREAAARQQQLLDESFRAAQNGDQTFHGRGDTQTGNAQMQSQAERQEQLRRDLEDTLRKISELGGDVPEQFARSEKAMRAAVQALRRGQAMNANQRESQALDELQKGLASLANQMARQMPGSGMASDGSSGFGGRDPLGRRPGPSGATDTRDVHIPAEADVSKAREILDELRRRASQFSRPKIERDYIDRLLRQF